MASLNLHGDRARIGLGGVGLLAALALVIVVPAALAGWLFALVFVGAVPIGSLCLLLIAQLVPGTWSEALSPGFERSALFLPVILVACLPVMLGAAALYPAPARDSFQALYLDDGLVLLRSVLILGAACVLVVAVLHGRGSGRALAAVGLIGFALLGTLLMTDWLMALDPAFHSSGFGLYAMMIEVVIALAAVAGLHLWRHRDAAPTQLLAAILLSGLMLWAYLGFMQYFISWSTDLTEGVAWYQLRGRDGWGVVAIAYSAVHLAGMFALLFPPVRRDWRWLFGICLATLAGKAMEIAWLIVPATGGGIATLAVVVVLFVAVALLAGPGWRLAGRVRQGLRGTAARTGAGP